MAVLGSVERQFAAMASNAGVWEGNLASYDRAGTVKSPKVPTILYVYCDSKDDAAKVAAGQAPYKLIFTLRKTESQRDGSQTFFQGVDMTVGARVFSSVGSMCSGAKYMTKGGSRVFLEANLNYRPASATSPIAARVRAVVIYSAEGHFESVSLFKERARAGECDTPPLALPPHPCTVPVAAEDFMQPGSGRVDAAPDTLAGTWRGSGEFLGPNGVCEIGVECGRTVRVQAGAMSIRDGAGVGDARAREASAEVREGEKCLALKADGGLEHMLLLGGGVFLRTPVVIDYAGECCVELGWLVEPSRLLASKRVYREGAWVGSLFCDETKM